jgi:peptidoglycan/LPS O-acetylase OafA/YrhL
MQTAKPNTDQNQRRYDIDWLRIVAILAVFFFHCARFFGGGSWHLMNREQSLVATLFIGLLDLWIMPLFFLLSGAGSWYSLRSRTGGQYLTERVKRILIPLYGIGAFILLPPQAYFELVTHRKGFAMTFWEFFPRHITSMFHGISFKSPFFFDIFYGHLWFLQYLFLISLAVLPLLLYLKSEKGQRLIAKLAGLCSHWGSIFLLLIPLALVRIGFTHLFKGEHTWADFLFYAVFFLIGYIMVADQRFTECIKKHWWICLALGIVGMGGEGFFIFGLRYNYANLYHPGGEPFSLMYVLFHIVMSIAIWSWVAFMLSMGAKYLNFSNKILPYGNETVLPFYILHQTIILLVGWYVIPLSMSIPLKYLIIAVCSFIIIMLLYEGLVRRFNVVRFLFGMRF